MKERKINLVRSYQVRTINPALLARASVACMFAVMLITFVGLYIYFAKRTNDLNTEIAYISSTVNNETEAKENVEYKQTREENQHYAKVKAVYDEDEEKMNELRTPTHEELQAFSRLAKNSNSLLDVEIVGIEFSRASSTISLNCEAESERAPHAFIQRLRGDAAFTDAEFLYYGFSTNSKKKVSFTIKYVL